MSRQSTSVLLSLMLVCACLALGAAATCSGRQTADFAAGLSVTADAVASGIDTVHALHSSGDLGTETALKVSREALDVTAIQREIVGGMLDIKQLDEQGQAGLADQLDRLIPRVNTLVEDGTLRVKDKQARVFTAATAAGGLAALRSLQSRLKSGAGAGFRVVIDDGTRARLRATADRVAENERRLRAFIGELQPADSVPE